MTSKIDTSNKALLALADRLDAPEYWLSGSNEGHEGENSAPVEAAATLRAIVVERQAQPATDDVIETLGKWLQNAAAAGWAGRDSAYYESNEMATALLAQIAPSLRAEGMEMAAERERKLARRIHMQRAELRWFHAWMSGDLRSLRREIAKRTLLATIPPTQASTIEARRAVFEAVWKSAQAKQKALRAEAKLDRARIGNATVNGTDPDV